MDIKQLRGDDWAISETEIIWTFLMLEINRCPHCSKKLIEDGPYRWKCPSNCFGESTRLMIG